MHTDPSPCENVIEMLAEWYIKYIKCRKIFKMRLVEAYKIQNDNC